MMAELSREDGTFIIELLEYQARLAQEQCRKWHDENDGDKAKTCLRLAEYFKANEAHKPTSEEITEHLTALNNAYQQLNTTSHLEFAKADWTFQEESTWFARNSLVRHFYEGQWLVRECPNDITETGE